MKVAFLSRFTPSLLSAEALEQLFVQRSRLAERIVEGIRESALTPNKHYYLVTGPRGIGKTHLVSLIFHRLRQDEELRGKLRIAWLREEEWGVASYLDLLLVVLRALQESGEDPELREKYRGVKALADPDQAQAAAERLLIEAVEGLTLLIIAENLDEIFRGIEGEGQRQLRALLQNHAVFTILGTAQSLFEDVTSRDEPFYGFFETSQLEELTFENGVELVARIAEQEGNTELGRVLASPLGRARMRAVHHLAAGNPRVYVVFSQFLTAESLDELVQPLLQTLDDLTPYYQGRMARLSPQQRKIVEFLCEHRGAATVTEIAQANFIAPQTTSSQLRRMAELGYVRSEQHGRASYYELREPLLRLTLEVKKLRGGPVRLIVEFLRLWYSERELTQRLSAVHARGDKSYLEAALQLQRQQGKDLILQACRMDLDRYSGAGDTTRASAVADEILAVGGTLDDYTRIAELPGAATAQVAEALLRKGASLNAVGRTEEGLEAYDELVNRLSDRREESLALPMAIALLRKGATLIALGRSEEAVEVGDELVGRFEGRSEEPLSEPVARARLLKGFALHLLGRSEEAIEAYDEVVGRFGERGEESLAQPVAAALVHKAFSLVSLGRSEEAIDVYDEVVGCFGERNEESLAKAVAQALVSKGIRLSVLGRSEEAVAVYDEVARRFGEWNEKSLAEQVARALFIKGLSLNALGRWEEAIGVFDEVLGRFGERNEKALAEQVARALFIKGLSLFVLGRSEEAIGVYDEVLGRFGERDEVSLAEQVARALVNKGITLDALGRSEVALEVYDEVVGRFGERNEVSLAEQVARALVNKGITLDALGHPSKAVEVSDEVVARFGARSEESLAEQVARALLNKGFTLSARGCSEEAVGAYAAVVDRFGARREESLNAVVAEATLGRGLALASCGGLAEGRREVDRSALLRQGSGETPWRVGVAAIVGLLRRGHKETAWGPAIGFFIETFARHGQLGKLGGALVESIRSLRKESVRSGTAAQWLRVWTDLAGGEEEMQIPLRLLKTAVEYVEERDETVLQALPAEEREVLRELLAREDRASGDSGPPSAPRTSPRPRGPRGRSARKR